MPPKNPWYLITSDEIDTIRESLQMTAGAAPFTRREQGRGDHPASLIRPGSPPMKGIPFVRAHAAGLLLAGILLLSAFLNLWNIWNAGITNTFYAAAVKSMLENPSLLVYNSFDPGGFITVDKPPLGLWVQCISAALLGFSGWALVLPQALAGVGSVALVYLIVSRPFGKTRRAGLGICPCRHPDLCCSIAERHHGWHPHLRPAPCRLGSTQGSPRAVAALAAHISDPCRPRVQHQDDPGPHCRTRHYCDLSDGDTQPPGETCGLAHLFLAVAVLAAVSLSWAVAVDMVPADQRPYIGGSGDNTVLGLIINYNGIHRLENGMMMHGRERGRPPPPA